MSVNRITGREGPHTDAADPAAPGDPGPGAQAQRRLRRRPGPPVRRVGRDHPARPAQAGRQGPARPGLRRGPPPRPAGPRWALPPARPSPGRGARGRAPAGPIAILPASSAARGTPVTSAAGTGARGVPRPPPAALEGRVPTNSAPVARELPPRREIELLLCGGQVRPGD